MKTKSIFSNHIVMLAALFLFFIGYFVSIYRGNTNSASNYSCLIIAASCMYSGNPTFGGELPENRALRLLARLNGLLLVIWFVIIIAQLFL